jgi:hypothetical protein
MGASEQAVYAVPNRRVTLEMAANDGEFGLLCVRA